MNAAAQIAPAQVHARAPADTDAPSRSALGAVLDLLPDGAVVVDATRRVLATNAEFRRSERRRCALVVRDRILVATHPSIDAHLAARLAAVLRDGAERVLRVPVTGAADALELRIAPHPGPHGELHAVVLVHDVQRTRAVCTTRLRELYDLTRAEAHVAARLAAGASLERVAAQLDVSLNTVRTHLRHLFAKCGVATQAALLQRLALGAARTGTRGEMAPSDDDAAAASSEPSR